VSRDDWASKAYQQILETGDDWADKKTAFNALDRSRHTVLAEIKLSFTDIKSDAGKETAARASQEYKDFCNTLEKAESDFNHADVKYIASKTLASLRQTQESLKKAEITAQNQMA
jgi:hypothetical protein